MDMYSTDVMNAVVASLLGDPQFLIDRYFGITQTETSEEIHFDVMDGKRRIAPFVSPLVEGQIVADLGFKTYTFKPAYIKDKRVFDMNKPLKRSPGEPIGGNLSPENRLRALMATSMRDQLTMLNRRMEVMAGEILATGKLTISGDKYATVIVDFGRAPGNTVTAAKLWSDPTSTPIADLNAWSLTSLQSQGIMLNDVLMSPDAWATFRANESVNDYLSRIRILTAPPSLQANQILGEGGFYMGTIDNFNIWVYQAWYVDPADAVEKPVLPAGSVILTSPQMQGVRAFGAIRDEEAGLQATPQFVKSWIEPDPSVRFIMLQSAPLLVPYRVNAAFKAKVL
jgi:hypothetical protein